MKEQIKRKEADEVRVALLVASAVIRASLTHTHTPAEVKEREAVCGEEEQRRSEGKVDAASESCVRISGWLRGRVNGASSCSTPIAVGARKCLARQVPTATRGRAINTMGCPALIQGGRRA